MKKAFSFLLILYFSLFLSGCTQESGDKKDVLAKINEYELLLEEFEDQLVAELELEKDFKPTQEARNEFLEQIIRKELLIQEAKKLGLDRKKKFMHTIERYWESTLIRDLMELKGDEFDKRTYVSEEEISKRYQEMKKRDVALPPLEEMRDRIIKKLKDEKRRAKLKNWISHLRKSAKIKIDQKLLNRSS
ncbi:MAG: SurA N-terminal domain-containing protein [Desulfobacterales bacterium]